MLLPLLATLRSREREKVVADRMRVVRGKQIKNEERAGVRSQISNVPDYFLAFFFPTLVRSGFNFFCFASFVVRTIGTLLAA